jgi:hypothetical protein
MPARTSSIGISGVTAGADVVARSDVASRAIAAAVTGATDDTDTTARTADDLYRAWVTDDTEKTGGRKFMSLWGKTRGAPSVIRSNCLQVKGKGVIVRSSR